MCTQMESKQTPKPTNAKWVTCSFWRDRQIHFDVNHPWLLPICQKPHPFPGIIHAVIFFPSVFRGTSMLWVSKLETSCSCFLCKNTCLNSSKAKGKSRLSALVTALDKNSAETIPKTSSEAKQCTCAGMTPAGLPDSPLSFSVVWSSSATDRYWHWTTPGWR